MQFPTTHRSVPGPDQTHREPAVTKEDRGQPGQVTQCLGTDLFVGSLSTHSSGSRICTCWSEVCECTSMYFSS